MRWRTEVTRVARIDLIRHVAADPASVALLLSGPTGRDLWPAGSLALAPPRRSGVGFRVDFTVADSTAARGRILVAASTDGPVASEVKLTLSTPDVSAFGLRRAAERFVEELAAAAQERSSAA